MTNQQIDERFKVLSEKITPSTSPEEILDIVKTDLLEEYHNWDCRKSSISLDKNRPKIDVIPMMCPKCFKKKIFRVNFDSGDIDDIRIEVVHNCSNCNCDMVALDPAIYNAIILLNRRGYITSWSCEGHNSPKDHLYVSFKDTSFLYNILKNNIKFPSSLKVEISTNMNTDENIAIIRGKKKDTEIKDFINLTKELFKFKREENNANIIDESGN